MCVVRSLLTFLNFVFVLRIKNKTSFASRRKVDDNMPFKISRDILIRGVGVILRVPALFIAEAWYRSDPATIQNQYSNLSKNKVERSHEIIFHVLYYTAIFFSAAVMILPLQKLVNFYMYIVSGLLMGLAHYLSFQFVASEQSSESTCSLLEDQDCIQRLALNLAVQGAISAAIGYLVNLRHWNKLLLLMYTAPMVARILGFPVDDLHRVHNFSSICAILLMMFFIFDHIPLVLDLVKAGVRQMTVAVQLYGWIPFLIAMWFKILLPMQFLMFWLVLFVLQLFKYFSVVNHPIFAEGWVVVLLASIGECCVSPFSLIGLCISVAYVSYVVLMCTKIILQGRDAFAVDNVMHRGWTEGFTMFLLAVQTGITELKAAQRAFLMSIVLFIVLSSLIQSMFEITDPILLSLGASHNKSVLKHARVISMCTFLWMFPIFMTMTICQFFDLDFWLMVVVSSCILTSVQVLGSLVVYALFLYDTIREEEWESLDDVVYYAKATTRVLEFVVAVFVVAYGVRESLFGEWSWVNTSILFIHCYFNVWQRLQAGWKSYLLRREAVKKIESLPIATDQQLQQLNDVCAICFQELKTARVTPCHHFYHAVCLRKWLYVQENCPLCHAKIIVKDDDEDSNDNEPHNNDNREDSDGDDSSVETNTDSEDDRYHEVPPSPNSTRPGLGRVGLRDGRGDGMYYRDIPHSALTRVSAHSSRSRDQYLHNGNSQTDLLPGTSQGSRPRYPNADGLHRHGNSRGERIHNLPHFHRT